MEKKQKTVSKGADQISIITSIGDEFNSAIPAREGLELAVLFTNDRINRIRGKKKGQEVHLVVIRLQMEMEFHDLARKCFNDVQSSSTR